MSSRAILRAVSSVRHAHTAPPATTTRINNTPVHEEVMKNWKPQTPESPKQDGWALKRWPFSVKSGNGFYFKYLIYVWTGFWAPFVIVQYQLKKANKGK